jgi:hypothetical protein
MIGERNADWKRWMIATAASTTDEAPGPMPNGKRQLRVSVRPETEGS